MTSFAHVSYPAQHPGVIRAENAIAALKNVAAGFDGARGAASLLLAAVVAALLVVANQVIDTWGDGHLLAAWMVLWLVAFAALALLTSSALVGVQLWLFMWAPLHGRALPVSLGYFLLPLVNSTDLSLLSR